MSRLTAIQEKEIRDAAMDSKIGAFIGKRLLAELDAMKLEIQTLKNENDRLCDDIELLRLSLEKKNEK